MAKYKAYPEYKDSGVEWLGAIPEDWSVTKLKYIADLLTAKSTNSDDLFVGLENISSGDGKYISKEENIADGASVSFEKNDVLFGKLRPYLAKSWLATFSGVCSSEFLVLRTAKLHPKYLNYFSLTNEFIDQVNSSTYGSKMPRASWEFIGLLPVPTCSYSLSEKVARFLDHETAKIDNLIAKQQQLIELLKEKRQAVISHAVTKGLDPDVPMKDSGVEWLGGIPQHWGVTRLKYECRNIVDCPHSTPNYTDEGEYPAIRTADILAGYLDLQNCRRVTEPVYNERNFRLIPKAGDIIYSREGERFGIGAPIPEGAKVCLAQRVMLFRAKSTSGYLMWALNSSSTYTQAQQDCIGSTSPHVNVDTIKNFILAWPPESEREEISNFIHQTLDSVESLTVHLTEKLTLLQERRTALISAAVTGKIDVRDWVAPDTQDVEEPQEATA
ncbi:UNVERIFIED_ORG: type I restriction enzyme S subunit [Pantoea brenneri]|nr:type I restriction enzyme S subunit [Pantoea brenneri]